MFNDTSQNSAGYWRELFATLKDRLETPSRHPTFVMYFIGIIVLLGGFGMLVPLVGRSCGNWADDTWMQAFVNACYTYFVAIAATAAVDLILSHRQRRFLLMFVLLCSFIVYLCAILAALASKPSVALTPASIGYVLALFLWWIGNADNANLLDTPIEPTSPMGADMKANLSGDLSGFKS